jgi:sterol desaturase/sphingolipid hydroxylase (fatty acid hydroxylase superfamily)
MSIATAPAISLSGIVVTTLALTAIIAVRYVLMAGAVYWLLWKRTPKKALRLNPDAPKPELVRYELRLSILSSWIYALPAAVALEAWKAGYTLMYLDVGKYGIAWLLISGLIYVAVQDTWYYWLHRAMHHRSVFRYIHAGHHRSRQPTPFASFSFDAAEAALNAWLLPAMVFVVPVHPAVILTILTIATIAAVLNHSGWEVLPPAFVRGPVGSWLISATHHSAHHTGFRRNYGLYFRFWDRIMGTDDMPGEAPRPGRATSP